MLNLISITLVVLIQLCESRNRYDNIPDIKLNNTQIYQKYGYYTEEYVVETEDGYLLDLYRVNNGKKQTYPKKYPILLVHGLLGSSEQWNFVGRNKSLPFLLADQGNDIWLANCRGSTHARKHRTLNPDTDKEFWYFSWHEIGVYDLPATIDFVLEKTGFKKLLYVGHSQGTTVYFVMASERPEYNDKIELSINLGPTVFLIHMKNVGFKLISPFYRILENLATSLNQYEFVPFMSNKDFRNTELFFCNPKAVTRDICSFMFTVLTGNDIEQMDMSIIPYVMSTFPAGASMRQLIHYAQGMVNGNFEQYDFGPIENMKKYNSLRPPRYNLTNIKTPIAILYAANDDLNTEQDVIKLAKLLPNVVEFYKVPYDLFSHDDFVWAKDLHTLVYPKLFQIINDYVTVK